MLITAGGLGAGSTRLHDPLLESLHLSWLRFGHGLVLSSTLLWGGVAMMLVAWLWLGRRVIAGDPGRPADEYTMVATTGFWLAPLLLSVPVFSRDTYSYLAQGALLRDGFDPYVVGPIENPNPLLDNVSPIWTTTTAPYGPAFIMVAKFVTMIVGEHVVAGTMLLRLCMLPGLILLIWAAPTGRPPHRRQRRCGAVDLRAQPAGDHPPHGWRPQRDADGRADDGRAGTGPEQPPGGGRRGDRRRRRGQSDRRTGAAVHRLDLDATAERSPGLPRAAGLRDGHHRGAADLRRRLRGVVLGRRRRPGMADRRWRPETSRSSTG